jgi:hypothetical protein
MEASPIPISAVNNFDVHRYPRVKLVDGKSVIWFIKSTALSASSLLFDLNGEASTARTNQISAISAPV